MCKQTNTTFRPYCAQLFAQIIDCTVVIYKQKPSSPGYITRNSQYMMVQPPNMGCQRDIYPVFTDIGNYLPISENELPISVNKLPISVNKLPISVNHFPISVNHFPIWWRHQMETFSALLVFCAGNSPMTGEFPAQRRVTQNFDVFFDLQLN